MLDLVLRRQHMSVDDLVADLGVSAATVRRDLDDLANQQLLIRSRGGASANLSAGALPLRYRAPAHSGAKTAIARYAAGLARPGSVIGMNGGTTTTAVAQELGSRPEFHDPDRTTTVVTNAVNIAQELAVRPHLQLVMTGGVVRERTFELVGDWAEGVLAQVRLDLLFLGVNGIDVADGVTTVDQAEASVNARLVERSARVVVVADASKVGRATFARICALDHVDDLITDSRADPVVLADLTAAGVRIHRADAPEESSLHVQ